jgi:hypothetical protein
LEYASVVFREHFSGGMKHTRLNTTEAFAERLKELCAMDGHDEDERA